MNRIKGRIKLILGELLYLKPDFTAGIKIAFYLGSQSKIYIFVYKINLYLYTNIVKEGWE